MKVLNKANHPMKVVRALMVLTGHQYAFCDKMREKDGRARWSIKVWGWGANEMQLAKDLLHAHGYDVEQTPGYSDHRIWVRKAPFIRL